MTRRRMIVAAMTLVAVLASAAWIWPDALTAEEEAVVGDWTSRAGTRHMTLTFTADHRFIRHTSISSYPAESAGRWWVNDGWLYLDFESGAFRRTFRPLLVWLGLPVTVVGSERTTAFELRYARVGPD